MGSTINLNLRATKDGIIDKAGNTLELALANAPTYTEQSILSPTGRAIGFDSTRRYKIKKQNPILTSESGDYTLSYWVKWNTVPTDWCVPAFNARLGATEYQNIRIHSFNQTLYCQYNPPANNFGQLLTIITNTWYHICCTCKDNYIRIFINGNKKFELSPAVLARTYWSTANQYFEVGGGCDRNYYLDGYLDDVFAIQGVALFTEDFIPPTTYMDITNYDSLKIHRIKSLKQY